MPLNKSKSKAAFQENVRTEIAAGKPPKQAVAIAYATQGEKKAPAQAHHSEHSEQRSQHYHTHVIEAGRTRRGSEMMTERRGQKDNREETDEKL